MSGMPSPQTPGESLTSANALKIARSPSGSSTKTIQRRAAPSEPPPVIAAIREPGQVTRSAAGVLEHPGSRARLDLRHRARIRSTGLLLRSRLGRRTGPSQPRPTPTAACPAAASAPNAATPGRPAPSHGDTDSGVAKRRMPGASITTPDRGRPVATSHPGQPAPGRRSSWWPRRHRSRPGPRRWRWSPKRRADSPLPAAARRPAG
jgi:hypothetical protein